MSTRLSGVQTGSGIMTSELQAAIAAGYYLTKERFACYYVWAYTIKIAGPFQSKTVARKAMLKLYRQQNHERIATMTLALGPISDTNEIKDLVTIANVSAFDVLTRDRVAFHVDKEPMFLSNGEKVPKAWATVRTDTDAVLGVVGDRYHVIQNQAGLDLFDAAAAKGAIEYGRAGTFKGGAVVWLQAKLPNSLKIGPDEVARYLLLANTHDGSGNLRILLTPIRVICKNTLAMALSDKASGMSIRHTFSAAAKVKAATAAIEGASMYYERFKAIGDAMFNKRLSLTAVKQRVADIFPGTVTDDEDPAKVSARTENVRAKVIDLVERGQGQYAIRGTAWGVYNAVAEYTDHHRSTRGDESNRLESAWLGSGAQIKRKAFDILMNS